ncbi:MAG: gamma-glutamylcyclotransferase [Byssovorax sp.]
MPDDDLDALTHKTLAHYDASAEAFWEGTRGHDVSQNHRALLDAIEAAPPFTLLDLGCGPGRDLLFFRSLGHTVVGLDGSPRFVAMARERSGCEVLHQDFIHLDLPAGRFDGIFANASLFHVPSAALPRVLAVLRAALKPRGVLFCSNPRGDDQEGWSGDRYGCFWTLETWRAHVGRAGFEEIDHYYRPAGKPRHQQPWLATVWRAIAAQESADVRLFVYGTLLAGESNHALLSEARFAGSARTLPLYRLLDLGGHPALVEGGSAAVVGEIYDVPAASLPALDALEGHPGWYRRTRITLADGSTAETYLLPRDQAEAFPEIASGSWRSRG